MSDVIFITCEANCDFCGWVSDSFDTDSQAEVAGHEHLVEFHEGNPE